VEACLVLTFPLNISNNSQRFWGDLSRLILLGQSYM
jgi:hypothetical protein